MRGQIFMTQEEANNLVMGHAEPSDVLDELKNAGYVTIVEMQDGGWAQVDPAPPMYDPIPTPKPPEVHDAHDILEEGASLGGDPVAEGEPLEPGPPGFGNLG